MQCTYLSIYTLYYSGDPSALYINVEMCPIIICIDPVSLLMPKLTSITTDTIFFIDF